jgi:hypothetical protein
MLQGVKTLFPSNKQTSTFQCNHNKEFWHTYPAPSTDVFALEGCDKVSSQQWGSPHSETLHETKNKDGENELTRRYETAKLLGTLH